MSTPKYYKKYKYEEYFVNEGKIRKLYELYIHKTMYEKFLHILVLMAMIFTLMGFILNFLVGIDNIVLVTIKSLSLFILFIFILELIRDYALSKGKKDFLKHHWIDLLLVVFLSIYFLFVSALFFLQFLMLDYLKPFVQDLKNTRVTYKLFKGEGEE